MKKLFLIPAILAGSLALAQQQKYEISPMIGYNIAEGNLNIKNDGYLTGGVEVQFNTPHSKMSPEFSLLYSRGVDYSSSSSNAGEETKVVRGAFNGVYTFEPYTMFTPFVKLGVGVESISNASLAVDNGFFLDAGTGAKVTLTQSLALKFEALYMAKLNDRAGFADNNLIMMAGLTFSFGGSTKETPAIVEVVEETTVVAVIADLDDDKDGVPNSKDNCNYTLSGRKVDVLGCALIIDNDRDGVNNDNDKCPNTLQGNKVDTDGCKIIPDSDNDGILDNKDLCQNTPLGEAVNSDGCQKELHLHINFKNDSVVIQDSSMKDIEKFAQFLKEYTNYHAKIVGYTDNVGSANYNKKLSLNRAIRIKMELIAQGVNPNQLTASGMGEANPIADNSTSEGREKNRRIEAELTRD